MSLATLTIGDTFDNPATLSAGQPSEPYNVFTATSIKATITNEAGTQRYCEVIELDRSTVGSDWTNGVIVYEFTAEITAQIAEHVTKPELGRIETQVEINGKKYSWSTPINIRLGNID